jgi:hypothetical protein
MFNTKVGYDGVAYETNIPRILVYYSADMLIILHIKGILNLETERLTANFFDDNFKHVVVSAMKIRL